MTKPPRQHERHGSSSHTSESFVPTSSSPSSYRRHSTEAAGTATNKQYITGHCHCPVLKRRELTLTRHSSLACPPRGRSIIAPVQKYAWNRQRGNSFLRLVREWSLEKKGVGRVDSDIPLSPYYSPNNATNS
ncbi:uncharacterized protein MYCFIDRAFT_169082 [Pseudocercospora fijiensis CIRAD86]|uniref:Uncharacterized protein n=1 Tax=Pseudocercospora fijiensis (strain CIRAD86) TaxID=383855 RepID=N1Q6Y5_PSEFD|nr:uncharacterized protein MYCFIDRAFT_169082 [Pseudocercospora fijiensis CIRAD86]EME87226.1 hypothetical protein MYCFIDRAFT_169082 [Pseudocercospora fijiensis CIRAD86]